MDDAAFKSFISENWPVYTRIFGGGDDVPWFRARPKLAGDKGTLPYLYVAGQEKFAMIPDGLYLRFYNSGEYCDAIIIECCQVSQNFQQKRGKYAPSMVATMVHVPDVWMNQSAGSNQLRRDVMSIVEEDAQYSYGCPVRAINILYVLPDALYKDVRENCVPHHYEYFISDSDFKNPTRNDVKTFLFRLDLWSRFFA